MFSESVECAKTIGFNRVERISPKKKKMKKRGKFETYSSKKHGKTRRKSYVKPIEKSSKNH